MKFVFDLDGTLTSQETLPIISTAFGVQEQIESLTRQTIQGHTPFVESFIKRVHILGQFPVSEVNTLLSTVPLFEQVLAFIRDNRDDCIIATGNFSGWIEKLLARIDCPSYSSEGIVKDDTIVKLTNILRKEDIVQRLKSAGEEVVFIGDGNNDVEAMRQADFSIASALVHEPAQSVLTVADYSVYDEGAFVRLLNQMKEKQSGRSVVLSCAGIGSRLGLGHTKALIELSGKSLIQWQLEGLQAEEDVRVVVGFQAKDVIEEVLKVRKDVIFAYNHDYFHTKTGASYYLGARHGNEYVIGWDGDLLVHPDDTQRCLDYKGQYVGCSKIVTEDAVFVRVDENKNITSFSRTNGDYEWTGPASLKRENIKFISNNVFNQIEEYLPLPMLYIRAQDVDTYEDYLKAQKFVESWER